MKRVNLFEMYQCGGGIKPLQKLTPDTRISDVQSLLMLADNWLEWILTPHHIPVADARKNAEKLRSFISALLNADDPKKTIGSAHTIIAVNLSEFESILSAELARLHIYSVTPVLGYDLDVLLSNGRANLTERTRRLLSEHAMAGFDEGCRCLALKLPTAAGFLLLRSVEDVMHDYYDVLSNGAARPARRSMGDYIAALETLPDVAPAMLEVLRSIKNLRRNPLMHPEHRLDIDDAIATFDVAKSAITAMARQAAEHRAEQPKPRARKRS
jgi:hypothetical protein